jgi:hypothetical protein
MVCGYGSYRSENSVVKSIKLKPKHPFHDVSLNQLIMSFFARHAFHISVPDPYRLSKDLHSRILTGPGSCS